MADHKLSRKQVELVLRRAAEIDASAPAARGVSGEESEALDVAELAKLAEEVGLRRSSVSSALSELGRGLLGGESGDELTPAVWSHQLVVSRQVPVSAEEGRRAVERFLKKQLMAVESREDDRVVWRRAHGLWRGLARSLAFVRRHAMGAATRVETQVRVEDGGHCSITFRMDVSEMRRSQLVVMASRSLVAFATLGLGGAALFPGFGVPDIVALAAGSAVAGGTMAWERWRYLELRRLLRLAPSRFLDGLVRAASDETDGD